MDKASFKQEAAQTEPTMAAKIAVNTFAVCISIALILCTIKLGVVLFG